MYGDMPKMIPARTAAPWSRTMRYASRYPQNPFSDSVVSVVRFREVRMGRRPKSVAPTKAAKAVWLWSVRSAPTGANK